MRRQEASRRQPGHGDDRGRDRLECAFENTFVPTGAITIRKKAFGKTGTIGFTISPETTPPSDVAYSKTAKVTEEGVAVLATGDATSDLPLGTYKIQELASEAPIRPGGL